MSISLNSETSWQTFNEFGKLIEGDGYSLPYRSSWDEEVDKHFNFDDHEMPITAVAVGEFTVEYFLKKWGASVLSFPITMPIWLDIAELANRFNRQKRDGSPANTPLTFPLNCLRMAKWERLQARKGEPRFDMWMGDYGDQILLAKS